MKAFGFEVIPFTCYSFHFSLITILFQFFRILLISKVLRNNICAGQEKQVLYYWKHKSAKGGTLGLTPFGSSQITNAKDKNKGKSKNPRAFLLESNFSSSSRSSRQVVWWFVTKVGSQICVLTHLLENL